MGLVNRSLRLLFPPGQAWRLPGVFGIFIDALALNFDRLRLFIRGIILESIPGTAEDMLPEWYDALDLPYDSTLLLADRQARAANAYNFVGDQTFAYLESRLQAELPNVYLVESYFDDEGVAAISGIGRSGIMRSGSGNPLYTFLVFGDVDTEEEYNRMLAILAKIFPLHLEPFIGVTIGGT